MVTSNDGTVLLVSQRIDPYRVNKMLRLVAGAEKLQGELWALIVKHVSPEVRDMLYTESGLRMLSTSLGDMLRPGSRQLLEGLDAQMRLLEEDITKASAMLAVADVIGDASTSPTVEQQTRLREFAEWRRGKSGGSGRAGSLRSKVVSSPANARRGRGEKAKATRREG